MARGFARGSSQYLTASVSGWNYTPLTLACWFYQISDNTEVMLSVGDGTTTYQMQVLRLSSQTVGALTYAGSSGTATAGSSHTLNAWHHGCAVFAASNSRAAYIDGGNKGTNTLDRSPTGPTIARIGTYAMSSLTDYMDGSIAEAAAWQAALSDEEVALLAKGLSPLFIQPQNLLAYWPLIRDTDHDIVNANDLTPTNSPTIAAHMDTLIRPAPLYTIIPPSAAAAYVFSPVSFPPFNPLRGRL